MPSAEPQTDVEPSGAVRRRRRTLLLPGCVVAGVALLAFAPVLRHEFVEGDDRSAIQHNPRLNPPTAAGLARYWTDMRPHKEFYVPVNYTAWWLLAHAARRAGPAGDEAVLDPLPFHAVNWVAHAINGALVLLVLYRLVGHRWAACVGAMLFVLHPLQAEPVAWASSMYSSLSGLFALLAVWQYLRFSDLRHGADGAPPRRRDAWVAYAVATLAFAAAVLTKPTAVVVPFIVGAMELFLRRRPVREVALPLGAWLALLAPVVLLARASQHGAPVYVPPLFPWRVLVALDSLAFYLFKLVVPLHLAPDYGRSPHWLLNQSEQVYLTWMAPVFLLVIACAVRREARWVLACVALFVAALLPSLGLVPFDYQRYSTVADRYAYLALLAPALAVAWVLANRPRPAVFAAAAVGTVALGGLATAQALRWRDTDTLYAHTVRVNPRSLAAHSVFGHRHAQAGDVNKALAEYDQALAANPGDPLVLSLVGDLYVRQRRLPEAAAAYREALLGMPDDASLHVNLGVVLAQAGQVDEGARLLRRATELEPEDAEAHANLATALSAKQDWAGARRHYEAALRINPESLTARRGVERLQALGQWGPRAE